MHTMLQPRDARTKISTRIKAISNKLTPKVWEDRVMPSRRKEHCGFAELASFSFKVEVNSYFEFAMMRLVLKNYSRLNEPT